MSWPLVIASLLAGQAGAAQAPIDVSSLKIGAPRVLALVDSGKLKGEPRKLAWSPEGATLYLQTAEGKPPLERFRHYVIPVESGRIESVDQEPDWAVQYWQVKQDRIAPGLPSLKIDIEQKSETIKTGTGPAGVLDRESSPTAVIANNPSTQNIADGVYGNQKANIVRLRLLGEPIAMWVNEPRPIPGTRFGWGPAGSGALVHVAEDGRLVLFDVQKRRQRLPNAKDTLLPAWSTDGSVLAYLQKTGKKKYDLVYVVVSR